MQEHTGVTILGDSVTYSARVGWCIRYSTFLFVLTTSRIPRPTMDTCSIEPLGVCILPELRSGWVRIGLAEGSPFLLSKTISLSDLCQFCCKQCSVNGLPLTTILLYALWQNLQRRACAWNRLAVRALQFPMVVAICRWNEGCWKIFERRLTLNVAWRGCSIPVRLIFGSTLQMKSRTSKIYPIGQLYTRPFPPLSPWKHDFKDAHCGSRMV